LGKIAQFGFALILLIWAPCSGIASILPPSPPLKGIALGLFHKERDADYKKELLEIRATGANAILLTATWYQYDIHANSIESRPMDGDKEFTIPDWLLIKVIREAHHLNLKVVLFPYLRLDQRKPREWRGVLDPKDFKLWARGYQAFILHYAALAARDGVGFLSVGSELGSMEEKKEFWEDLIRKVRANYRGKLLYSSNWDHYRFPSFWRNLDYISITAYFELTNSKDPKLAELMEKWREVKKRLLDFLAPYPQKLIFTEVGYPSIDGAGKDPWNYFAEGKVDVEEQALCYQAFMETWGGTPQLEGVFWWVWYGEGGLNDNSYTPKGKPAEEWLKRWFRPAQ